MKQCLWPDAMEESTDVCDCVFTSDFIKYNSLVLGLIQCVQINAGFSLG